MLLVTLACLVAAPSPAPLAQSSEQLEVLLKEGDPVPGLPDGWRIDQFLSRTIGADGGWAATVEVRGLGFGIVVVGQRPGRTDGPVELLRSDLPPGANTSDFMIGARLAGGRLAYSLAPFTWLNPAESVWVDDTMIARVGETISDRPGVTWNRSMGTVGFAPDGSAVVWGLVLLDPQFQGLKRLLWRWPEGETLIAEGDSIPGLATPVLRITEPIALSPDTRQWAVLVVLESDFREALVRNGALLEYTPGAYALEGEVIPPTFVDGHVGLTWDGFHALEINDRGHVAFVGQTSLGGEDRYVLVRNRRPYSFTDREPKLADIDERSGVLLVDAQALLFEDDEVLAASPSVDVDRDGVADAGFTAPFVSEFTSYMTRDERELLMYRPFNGPGGEVHLGVARARRARADETVCNAFVNSTGRPAELVATGSAIAIDNEVTLHAFGLPTASRGYSLFSRDFGIVVQPGGSQGQLCLQGAIGRLQSQLFLAGFDGRATIPLDLTQIPRPTGTAAAMAGDTWYAQAWFRDMDQGTPTSNFTSALRLELR
ncbi:MAG: hypothetical protein AAF726_01265 [Planctomycetota bacterium]